MKPFLTLVLLTFLITNSLLAQKKTKNTPQSWLAIEVGAPIIVKQNTISKFPLNIEFQKRKNNWGIGAALGLEYGKYLSGDCNRRVEVGTPVRFRDPGNTQLYNKYEAYCSKYQVYTFKPSVFGNFYFLQRRKINLFAKLGLTANIWSLSRTVGEYYEYDTNNISTTLVTHEVINTGPIHLVHTYQSWGINKVDLLSGLGLNYVLNKRTTFRMTLQSEVNVPFLTKNRENGVLLLGL